MPGPLPKSDKVRRNAPAIPTSALPAAGRKGAAPKSPLALGKVGAKWWTWAWSLPQAAGWSVGDEYLIARRAALEDDLDAAYRADFEDLAGLDDEELRALVRRLASLVTGRLGIMREMRELDDRLGLSPKGMAALRWKIVPIGDPTAGTTPTARYGALRAV